MSGVSVPDEEIRQVPVESSAPTAAAAEGGRSTDVRIERCECSYHVILSDQEFRLQILWQKSVNFAVFHEKVVNKRLTMV